MIRVTGILTCSTAEDADRVRTFLPDHIRFGRAEPGCLTFNVAPTADPLVWRLDESFVDKAAFAAHQMRTAASDWFAATAHLGRDLHVTDTGLPGQDRE